AGSHQLAQDLVTVGQSLLDVKAWERAEPLIREGLAIREKIQPDAWRTFNTKSLLGDALLGQKRYADAEPLLLAGYRGMKALEETMEPLGRMRIPKTLERLVRLYEAKGDPKEAAAWRARLEAARTTESAPSTRDTKR